MKEVTFNQDTVHVFIKKSLEKMQLCIKNVGLYEKLNSPKDNKEKQKNSLQRI